MISCIREGLPSPLPDWTHAGSGVAFVIVPMPRDYLGGPGTRHNLTAVAATMGACAKQPYHGPVEI